MSLTPEQRATLGFPSVQDDFWTEQTIRAVGIRFPKMDMSPYLLRLKSSLL